MRRAEHMWLAGHMAGHEQHATPAQQLARKGAAAAGSCCVLRAASCPCQHVLRLRLERRRTCRPCISCWYCCCDWRKVASTSSSAAGARDEGHECRPGSRPGHVTPPGRAAAPLPGSGPAGPCGLTLCGRRGRCRELPKLLRLAQRPGPGRGLRVEGSSSGVGGRPRAPGGGGSAAFRHPVPHQPLGGRAADLRQHRRGDLARARLRSDPRSLAALINWRVAGRSQAACQGRATPQLAAKPERSTGSRASWAEAT